jgi:hypothetical protein
MAALFAVLMVVPGLRDFFALSALPLLVWVGVVVVVAVAAAALTVVWWFSARADDVGTDS